MLSQVGLKELIATTIWYVWWERRQATHGENVQHPQRSVEAIAALVVNYAKARKPNSGIERTSWSKPHEGYVKLNVDAAFSIDKGSGAIIRDDQGMFLASSCRGVEYVTDAQTAEDLALRDGLILAGQIGCMKIMVESDCMEVVEIMREGGDTRNVTAAIYEDCTFLCRGFSHVSFNHCPREANKVDHVLACNS
uniref:RNase H type-1 domain-containing protein n=1 Tax=Arundo donax TaxID=35708 RepID=A0A0A9BCZ9_ARUDO